MPLDLVLRIVEEVGTVACIKQEAVPSPSRISALVKGMGRKVPILTGLGALYGGFELQRGADGFMTGFAFPEVLMAMVQAKDDDDRLMTLYTRYLPLIVFEQQPGVAIRKEVFRMRGLMDTSRVRHPGGNIDDSTRAQLEAIIKRVLGDADLTNRLEV
jgi:4-hydroxy-tetrahydrodipicolinate synthase